MNPPRAAWRVGKPTARPEPASLDGLIEEGTDAIPVRITIVQDNVTTGWDDGALGFEEDAVWFSGRATSFRLAAPDVRPGAYLLSRREPVTDGEALHQGLPLRHPTRDVWVRMALLTADEERKARDQARLVEGVKRLRASKEGGGASEYPPLAPRPGLLRPAHPKSARAQRRTRIAFAAGAVGAVFLDVLLTAIHRGPKVANLAGIMAFPLVVGALTGLEGSDEPEKRKLRQIDQEERSLLAATPP